MHNPPNTCHPQAAQRLFLAVVNQAISDFLENGNEAKEAERWLLSNDFDVLSRLFAHPAKTDGIGILNRNERSAPSHFRGMLDK